MTNHEECDKKTLSLESLPRVTSDWPQCKDLIFNMFKVRACTFDADTILWPFDVQNRSIYNWYEDKYRVTHSKYQVRKTYYEDYCRYLDDIFKKVDIIDEVDWFGQSKQDLERKSQEIILSTMAIEMKFCHVQQADLGELRWNLKTFLSMLRMVLELDPSDICETVSSDLFRSFLTSVGLHSLTGTYFSKPNFQYQSKNKKVVVTVSGEPDLLVCVRTSDAECLPVAVVVVKKDRLLCNIPRKRSTSPSHHQDECLRPGAAEAIEENIDAEQYEDVEDDYDTMQDDYPNGKLRLLTDDEERNVDLFLPQLMGEVLACGNSPRVKLVSVLPLNKHQQFSKSFIGLGVVGFKVYVVNFLGVIKDGPARECHMHDIPITRGIGTDILISEPLSLLKRADRNKLIRVLIALDGMTSHE